MRLGRTGRDSGDMGPASGITRGGLGPDLASLTHADGAFSELPPVALAGGHSGTGGGTAWRLPDRHSSERASEPRPARIEPRTLEQLHHQHPRRWQDLRGQIEGEFGEGDGPILVCGLNAATCSAPCPSTTSAPASRQGRANGGVCPPPFRAHFRDGDPFDGVHGQRSRASTVLGAYLLGSRLGPGRPGAAPWSWDDLAGAQTRCFLPRSLWVARERSWSWAAAF